MKLHKTVKIILLGPTDSGKTSLITSFIYGYPIIPKKPVIFGTFFKELELFNKKYQLKICDTTGAESLIKLQEMAFLDADILVFCSPLANQTDLINIEKYITNSNIPKILCITKSDLSKKLKEEKILEFLEIYKFDSKIECSINNIGSVRKLFEKIIECLNSQIVIEKNCCKSIFKCC